MYYFLAFVAGIVIVLFIVQKYTGLEFVKHAKLLWKTWSVWLSAVGVALGVYLASAPDALVQVWLMLPPDLKALLPVNVAQYISYAIIALGVISKFVRQPKLDQQRKEMEQRHD
jgi:hypothetical protein